MLEYVLGIIIDPEGNYLSFGKRDEADHSYSDADINSYGRSSLHSILDSGWLFSHKDLIVEDLSFADLNFSNNIDQIDKNIWHYFSLWSSLGYIILLNGGYLITGFLPGQLTGAQQETMMMLKSDILYSNFSYSDLYVSDELRSFINIQELYRTLERQKQKRSLVIYK